MLNKLTFLVGARYTLSKRHSHLIAFISRITVAGLIIGVALLVLVMSIMNGFDRELRERVLQIMPQVTIYNRKGIEFPENIVSIVKRHPEFVAASPFVQLQGLLTHNKEVAPAILFGINPEFEKKISSLESFLQLHKLNDLTAQNNGIILGVGLAKKLNVTIGDALTLILPRKRSNVSHPKIIALNVIDILHSGTEIDHSLALMNIDAASEISSHPGLASGIRIQVKDLFLADKTAYEMATELPFGFYSTNWTRRYGNIYQAIQTSKKMVGLLLFLLIAIATFNLVSTLIMIVVDKQGDIAILRTLGATTGDIIGIFLVQGGLIGCIGTVVGIILGVLLSLGVTPFVAWVEQLLNIQFLHSDVYPTSFLPSQVLWQDTVMVGATALTLSFLASLYPAWRASKVLPADALRYE